MIKNHVRVYAEDLNNKTVIKKDSEFEQNEKSLSTLSNFTYESLDAEDFDTAINRDSLVKKESQVKIKYYYKKVQDLLLNKYYDDAVIKLHSLINIIKNEIYKQIQKHCKGSQIRFLGEYELCHPLNVAVISALISKKLDFAPRNLDEVILAGLLHDIGKMEIDFPNNSALITVNEDEIKEHTILGYKIIKEKMGLPDSIAKVALNHHENNDGSGYPRGLSNDYIDEYSQIVNVANYYDNLAFNRTHVLVTNNKEAMREMLEVGTNNFSARMLFTFIHMFNYDDLKDFNDMVF